MEKSGERIEKEGCIRREKTIRRKKKEIGRRVWTGGC